MPDMRKRDKFKPGVPKSVLLFLAGFAWVCVGTMLLTYAFSWLSEETGATLFVCAGFSLALLVHHFGFLKIADRNLERILPMDGNRCFFSFINWKSYLVILVMVAMGMILRHSQIPRQYLSILYTGIGLALLFSSVRYFRLFIKEIRRQ